MLSDTVTVKLTIFKKCGTVYRAICDIRVGDCEIPRNVIIYLKCVKKWKRLGET